MKQLYIIVWQEREREPDWLHVVAGDNLTEERARNYVRKYLKEYEDVTDPDFEYFWHTSVTEANGVGTKNKYSVEVSKL